MLSLQDGKSQKTIVELSWVELWVTYSIIDLSSGKKRPRFERPLDVKRIPNQHFERQSVGFKSQDYCQDEDMTIFTFYLAINDKEKIPKDVKAKTFIGQD